jgi:hypothetical protein
VADISHLGAIAITAAIHNGTDAAAPITNDAVHLPGLGRLRLGRPDPGPSPAQVVASLAHDVVTIQAGADT